MAQAVVALAADRARLATMGRAAHASARRFSHEDYADWLVQLHREIWRERPRPWPALRPALPVGYRLSCMGTAYYMLARHKVAKALGRPLRES
jgi:hypothetical protein